MVFYELSPKELNRVTYHDNPLDNIWKLTMASRTSLFVTLYLQCNLIKGVFWCMGFPTFKPIVFYLTENKGENVVDW